MLPSYMRSTNKPAGALTPVNPLRLGNANPLTAQPTFGVLSNNEIENKATFASLKVGNKVTEELIEKVDDRNKKEVEDFDSPTEDFNSNKKRSQSRVKVRQKDKTVPKQVDDPKRQMVELKGPRVKHVCRSASIVLGQPIATFPTQEEKDKDKLGNVSSEDELPLVILEKEKLTPVICTDVDMKEIENKIPQVVPELSISKDSSEISVEPKKRKIEAAVQSKVQNKGESSEDESAMEIVPRKLALKPLTNITNVSLF